MTPLVLAAEVIDPGGAFAAEVAPLLDLGISGVLLAVILWFVRWYVRQIGTGEQVSRRELDYTRQDRDDRLADKDRQIDAYRAANEAGEMARELLSHQNRDLIDALRGYERFFDAFEDIIRRAQREDRAGEPRT